MLWVGVGGLTAIALGSIVGSYLLRERSVRLLIRSPAIIVAALAAVATILVLKNSFPGFASIIIYCALLTSVIFTLLTIRLMTKGRSFLTQFPAILGVGLSMLIAVVTYVVFFPSSKFDAEPFEGIQASIGKQKMVHLFVVHGMGIHCIGYSHKLVQGIADQLGLEAPGLNQSVRITKTEQKDFKKDHILAEFGLPESIVKLLLPIFKQKVPDTIFKTLNVLENKKCGDEFHDGNYEIVQPLGGHE